MATITHGGNTAFTKLITLVKTALGGKVDKVEGKVLSTNDLTDALKQGYDGAVTHAAAAHAPAGAQVNVIEAVKVNGTAAEIADKAVNIAVPTKVSEIANDSKFQTEEEVDAKIAAADHMKRKKVTSVDDIDASAAGAEEYIYMVPKGTGKNADKFDEYMVIDGAVEKVGDWEVNLDGYVQSKDITEMTADDVQTIWDSIT